MKYIKEAALKTKALYIMIVDILLSIVITSLNSVVLIWISNAIENHDNPMYWINLIIVECISVILLHYISTWARAYHIHMIFTYLNNMFADKILYADYDLFVKYSPSEILSTGQSLWQLSCVLRTILSCIKNAINFIIILIIIGIINKNIIIPIILLYSIGAIIILHCIKAIGKADTEMDNIKRDRNKELNEIIDGFAEVRSFAKEKIHSESIHNKNNSIINKIWIRTNKIGIENASILIIDSIVTIGMVLYSIVGLNTGYITNSTAMTLVMYGWRLIDPLVYFIESLDSISTEIAPLPKFINLMNYQNKVSKGNITLNSFNNEINLENISFKYEDSNYVLENLNLTIKKGQHIGICGTSGGGKSTLLKLIPKFYDVSTGAILIDGIDIRKLTTESIRNHIGSVQQDPYIIDDTIENNIRYAVNYPVSHYEIVEACKKAAIYDFIIDQPNKFETNVGPKGLKLSGGQKQRIALARLFIANPDIIILDEATSALDNETESIIQESLNMFKDKTMIIVAHRLSTIKDSDMIVVIDKHKVAEKGTHEELLQKDGIYATMYNKSITKL